MAKKARNLFFYLAIGCLVGLIAIFIFDGYLGLYDTIYVTSGEYEQTIETDDWLWQKQVGLAGARWGDKIIFRYKIDNRRFSAYSAPVQVSVWKENENLASLFSEDKSVKPFGVAEVNWILDSEWLESQGHSHGQYTVKINHGEVTRRVIVSFYSSEELGYPRPIPAR